MRDLFRKYVTKDRKGYKIQYFTRRAPIKKDECVDEEEKKPIRDSES